jgi:mRNA interferase MazF
MTTDQQRPPRVQPRIKAAPKIRQIYWCDFWHDAQLPEMWKTRPIIVVSFKNSLHGPCLVVPLSTVPHENADPWSYKLRSQIEGVTSWAICNQPSTVAPSRLSQFGGKIPMLPIEDFNQVLTRLLQWLPVPFPVEI